MNRRPGFVQGQDPLSVGGCENYVWKTQDFLGKGATANVYQGAHKTTGEPVAVKVFGTTGARRLQKDQLRVFQQQLRQQLQEMELLRKLDHENVVKLLASETEVEFQNKVAVMELCAGRSVATILGEPENAFGFNEEEFLLFLGHIVAGLCYLRDNSISHRDLKPGNIVLFITDDGRHIYKLTDFGAARSLEEDECFTTLCGTPEYLPADIYGKALLGIQDKNYFSPKVDLWSMGCTIYHTATGSLPFKPRRNREDKKGMHWILSNRQSGMISGIENEKGQVIWSRELPKTCQFSHGLRELVTPMLQNLFEQQTLWSFKDFFLEVDKLMSKNRCHIFDAHTCTEHILYLDPEEIVLGFQNLLVSKTQVPLENQLFVQKGLPLTKLDPTARVKERIHATTPVDPVILLSSFSMGIKLAEEKMSVPEVRFPDLRIESAYLDEDMEAGRIFTAVAYMVGRDIERMTRCHSFFLQIPSAIKSVISRKMEKLLELVQQSVDRASILNYILRPFAKYMGIITEVPGLQKNGCLEVQSLQAIVQERQTDIALIMEFIDSVQTQTLQLQAKYFPDSAKASTWHRGLKHCHDLTGRKEKANTFVNKIQTSWKELEEFRNRRPLSPNEQNFNQLEKRKMVQNRGKLLHLHLECSNALKLVTTDLDSWYSEAQVAFGQCQALTVELNQGVSRLKNFEHVLKKSEEECDEIIKMLFSAAKASEAANDVGPKPAQVTLTTTAVNGVADEASVKMLTVKPFKADEFEKCQNEIKLEMEENSSAIHELQVLTTRLILSLQD